MYMTKQTIIFLHGMYSSGDVWKPVLDTFKLYDTHTPHDIFTTTDLDNYVKTHNIHMPILVCHSFGCFIGLSYALDYKNVSNIVCYNPVGIFPIMNKYGYYISRTLKHVNTTYFNLFKYTLYSPISFKWFDIITSSTCNVPICKNIYCEYGTTQFRNYLINKMHLLPCKSIFLFTPYDNIVPLYNYELLRHIGYTCEIIDGYHTFDVTKPERIIEHIHKTQKCTNPLNVDLSNYYAHISTTTSQRHIDDMCSDILSSIF